MPLGTPQQDKTGRNVFGFSPWFPAGVALILALVVAVLALRSGRRQEEIMVQSFVSRGEALIWALEAGTRTWMGARAEGRVLQQLVEETAKQPGIEYIAVTDRNGLVQSHSDARRINSTFPVALPEGWEKTEDAGKSDWRVREEEGRTVFEVRSLFIPISEDHHAFNNYQRGHHGMGRGMGMGRRSRLGEQAHEAADNAEGGKSYVFVGMDNAPMEQALAEEYRRNLNGALLAAALGLGGLLSLLWAHSHRRSRRLLLDARALAEEVVTSLPSGLLTRDPQGNVGMINATALDMLGRERQDVVGRPLKDVPGLDWDALIGELGGKRSLEREASLRRGDAGKAITVSLSRVESEDGLFLGHLFILHDVEEVKRLREEVERGRRLTALGNLAAGVAHEIRNPLSSIKGLATFLAGRVPREGPEEDAAKTMVDEVNRLNRVVSELLEFARPGAIKLADADVREVIDGALRLASADAEAKGVTVKRDYQEDFPRVRVNRERLTQALLNLFLNAIQATPRGGELRVGLHIRTDGESYALTVADTGRGMGEEEMAAVFTPYYTTRPGGTGLGLPIVHQIVEAHGGGIGVRSVPGTGSEFTVTLPLLQ